MLPGFIYIPTGEIDEETLYRRNRVTDTHLRGQVVAATALAVVVRDGAVVGLGLLERSVRLAPGNTLYRQNFGLLLAETGNVAAA
jgi:hypothetical protein